MEISREVLERVARLEQGFEQLRPGLHFPSTATLEHRLRWLEIVMEEIRARDNHGVYAETPSEEKLKQLLAHTVYIKEDRITLKSLTADPASCVAGDIWFRSDLGKGKLAIDSVVANAVLTPDGVGGLAMFGDGSDGNHTVTAGYSGGPITNNALTRDAFFNNLTINSGVTLYTAGYRIFVKGTLINNGTIDRNGNAGGNGSNAPYSDGGAGGSGASGLGAGSIGGSVAGGAGGQGGSYDELGEGGYAASPGSNGAGATALGGNGGNGGAGGQCQPNATTQYGKAGGAGGTASAPTGGCRAMPFAAILRDIEATVVKIQGGAGGAGGGGGGGTQYGGGGGGGGGGGSGGGIIFIAAKAINNSSGTIRANGGSGGHGGSGYLAGGHYGGPGGGGGGGGGGAIVLIYITASWGTEQANGGSGGSKGANWSGSGVNGVAGPAGVVLKLLNA